MPFPAIRRIDRYDQMLGNLYRTTLRLSDVPLPVRLWQKSLSLTARRYETTVNRSLSKHKKHKPV